MSKSIIAKYCTVSNGYYLCSPGSRIFDLYFSTFEQMREFCYDMNWKLRRCDA